ncbi:MAG: hypothetical protein IH944_02440 [Armatimonadetes bacterium]|nr:hypothetical protein [Armatimonadota bacterium]
MKRIAPEQMWLDHALASFGCLLAVYAVGMSLINRPLAITLSVCIIVTSIIGFLLARALRDHPFRKYDSYLWAFFGVFSVGFVLRLNELLPEPGFQMNLIAAGALCWMLVFGSMVSWRDQTLLFLTLPCIAIFGLVGTFDTFPAGTLFFFLFLASIAVLYARVHQRSMIERAKAAGVAELALLRRGVWRWMAGPEWALASATLIILFSLVGGPLLRGSLKKVAGNVNVTITPPPQSISGNQATDNSDVKIGRGAQFNLDDDILEIDIEGQQYLRVTSYSTYTGSGWSQAGVSLPADSPLHTFEPDPRNPQRGPHGGIAAWSGFASPPYEPILNPESVEFWIRNVASNVRTIMTPGSISEVFVDAQDVTFGAGGLAWLDDGFPDGKEVRVYAIVRPDRARLDNAELPPALMPLQPLLESRERIPARVRDLAYRVTAGFDSDYEKARAIQDAIESRVRYNINSARVPNDEDPCEYFLYESKEGYCDLFATSMTLMARSVGLPARYAIGYLINEAERTDDGYYSISGKDYHAWAEIYFEDAGWVVFDPTEGAPDVDGAGVGSAANTAVPWYKRTWFIWTMVVTVLAAIAAPLSAMYLARAGTPGAKRVRTAGEVFRLHTSFYKSIEKLAGRPKRFSQTTREFVSLNEGKLGAEHGTASELVRQFESAMFSAESISRDALAKLSRTVAEFRSTLHRLRRAGA